MHTIQLTIKRDSTFSLSCLIFLCAFIFSQPSHAAMQDLTQQRLNLDKQQQQFSKQFFQTLTTRKAFNYALSTSMAELQKNITENSDDPLIQVAIIIQNLDLLKDNYDHKAIFPYIELLLDYNALSSAKSLISSIEQDADITTITHCHYLLALYYFDRQQWQTALNNLQEDGLNLAKKTYQHRLFITGITQQNLSKHRAAIKSYQKITQDSEYYYPAQFNIALANLRQGWWTQAHQVIESLKSQSKVKNNSIALDRIYITLGYSLLKKGYFRTSKELFQKVSIESRYTNQALLGIALTSAQQDDYLGGLSASRILKNKTEDQLPVYEAHLLMPFFYEKTQQRMTASIGYSEASDYYQKKLASIKELMQQPIDFTRYPIAHNREVVLSVDDIDIDLAQHYPRPFFVTRAQLPTYQRWITTLNSNALNNSYLQLEKAYHNLTDKMVNKTLQEKYDNISSYLDQTRYGLARLYDNNMAQQ